MKDILNGLALVLASKSPRRAQLLTQAGIPFTVKVQDVAEDYPAELPALDVAPYLAQKKAAGCLDLLSSDRQVLLCADSVVILDDIIYGKPTDRAAAITTVLALSGRQHTVITGVCLRSQRRELVFHGRSEVFFNPISPTEAAYYVDHYQPYDKAGAYAIQEWIGLCKIHRIEGTYHNIMGLPVDLVYQHLTDGGWD